VFAREDDVNNDWRLKAKARTKDLCTFLIYKLVNLSGELDKIYENSHTAIRSIVHNIVTVSVVISQHLAQHCHYNVSYQVFRQWHASCYTLERQKFQGKSSTFMLCGAASAVHSARRLVPRMRMLLWWTEDVTKQWLMPGNFLKQSSDSSQSDDYASWCAGGILSALMQGRKLLNK